MDRDVHDVVDDFGWWCRDWHVDWHRDMLDVRDGVVMRPQRANDVCRSATLVQICCSKSSQAKRPIHPYRDFCLFAISGTE